MNTSSSCPCCSESMLLHLSSRRSYWFCSHCRLEMPDISSFKQTKENNAVSFKESLKAAIPAMKAEQAVAY